MKELVSLMSLKVITANINGIRATTRKGFFQWMQAQKADVVCLQELKAQAEHLQEPVMNPEGYQHYYHCAEKKGYSGVSIYTRHTPEQVHKSFGWSLADGEGRYIQIDLPEVSIVSVYFPSGSSGEKRQTIKFEFMHQFEQHLAQLKRGKRPFILCGDWNIVHKEIDIKNWKSNQKNSGCLPEERAWLDKVFGSMQFIDAFRAVNTNAEEYTWWSNRGQARANNVGWRIDYQVLSHHLSSAVKKASIYRDQSFSDHAPLIIEYQI